MQERDGMFRLITPQTDTELASYYNFRWRILREPWHMPVGSERDAYDELSWHRMIVEDKGETIAVENVLTTANIIHLHVAVPFLKTSRKSSIKPLLSLSLGLFIFVTWVINTKNRETPATKWIQYNGLIPSTPIPPK